MAVLANFAIIIPDNSVLQQEWRVSGSVLHCR